MLKKSLYYCFIYLIASVSVLYAQSITWEEVETNLPDGAVFFKGTSASPAWNVWYVEIDYSNTDLTVRPFFAQSGNQATSVIANNADAYAAINAGYFGTNVSYSLVMKNGELLSPNLSAVSRTAGTYYPTRATFGITKDRELDMTWVYHISGFMYSYPVPTPNTTTTPAPQPTPSYPEGGRIWDDIVDAVGGGPRLIEDGQINITYIEEVFFDSGVEGNSRQPRTAVGFTDDNKIIFFLVDGRQVVSVGMTLHEVAQTMLDIGCVEAVNLDGGGSSTMVVDGARVNLPAGGTWERPVMSILALISTPEPEPDPTFEKIYHHTDSDFYYEVGSGWLTSANTAYGTTRIKVVGDGSAYAVFKPDLPVSAEYELYASWSASSNRAVDTPYIIMHRDGIDTVRVDQTRTVGLWNHLGDYVMSSQDSITISDEASAGSGTTYIVVDAIRFVSYDESIVSVDEHETGLPESVALYQNFPNPFNPETLIRFSLPDRMHVNLSVYDILGRKVAELVDGELIHGHYEVPFSARDLSSGLYIYRLTTDYSIAQKRMIYLK